MQDDRGGDRESEHEDTMKEKMVCVLYDPARTRKRSPSYRDITVYPKIPYRPDLPTDIRLYLCVVGDARVHIDHALPTRIACYDM